MQKFARRVLTTFVFSTLGFLGLGFAANALTVIPLFTVSPNPINAGQSSTLELSVVALPAVGSEIVSLGSSSSIVLASGNGSFAAPTLGSINALNGLGIHGQTSFSYPNPGTFLAAYSFTLLSIVECIQNTTTCETSASVSGSASIDLVVNPVPQVPLPAALPLFATGLGALVLLGWRRKRKSAV